MAGRGSEGWCPKEQAEMRAGGSTQKMKGRGQASAIGAKVLYYGDGSRCPVGDNLHNPWLGCQLA